MNTKTTVVLALLVVIGGILLVLEKPWEDAAGRQAAENRPQAGGPKPLLDSPPGVESVLGLELAVADQPTIVARRDDQTWRITEPISCVAETWLPGHVIRRCLDLRYTRKFAPGDEGAPSAAEAGLDPPRIIVTLHRDQDQPPLVFRFGRQAPLSTNYYAALEPPDIYVVNEDVARTFRRTLQEFRSKKIFDFAGDEVKSVAVAGARNYELARGGDNQWIINRPVRARANKARASSLVSSLRNLRAKNFVDDQPADLAPYGLDTPNWTIALTVEKTVEPEEASEETQPQDQTAAEQEQEEPATAPAVERTEYALLFGGPAGNDRYAKLADQPWVFTISETTLTSLTPELLELRDKTLCDFDRADVDRIELHLAGLHETIRKEGGDWVLSNGARAEPIAVDDLLKSMEGLQAAAFEDRPPLVDTGLESPRAELTLAVAGRVEPIKLVVGYPTASGKMVYARGGDDPTIAVLRAETVAPLLVAPISYRDRQILDFNKSHAVNLEITREDRTFTLVESFGQWRLTAPVEAPAEAESVSNILADLNNLRAKTVVAADSGSAYGLDEPWVRVAVTIQPPAQTPAPELEETDTEPAATQPAPATQPKPTTQPEPTSPPEPATQPTPATQPEAIQPPPETYVLLMAATPDGKIYARLEDGELVYEVDHTVLDNLLAELHDRKAIPVDRSTRPVKLTFRNPDRTLTLEKVGKDKWIAEADPALPIDSAKVDGAVNDLRRLKTGKFVSYHTEDLAEFGLDQPAITVSVVDRHGGLAELHVSARGPDNDPDRSRYATVPGSHKVFLLPAEKLATLDRTLTDFEKTE